MNEGFTGRLATPFTVARTGDTSDRATVNWQVTSSQASGSDFFGGVLPSGHLSFAANDSPRPSWSLVQATSRSRPTRRSRS
jgi:hypothetical protein